MNSPEDERISAACSLEDPQVIRALCEYREALAAGYPLEQRDVLRKFPQIQDELRNCLDALDMMQDMAGRIHKSGLGGARKLGARVLPDSENLLGDFRLIRMIGRGGMGVVYEAEQLSLQRRVALKILPASVVLDPTNLRRFKIESQAAASLDHPNIVSVYAVGCEEGVHYYAMQYIHGQTLDQIIRRLRAESRKGQGRGAPDGNGRPAAGENSRSARPATPPAAGMLEPTTLSPAPGNLNEPSAPTSAWRMPRGEPGPPPMIAISEPAAVAEAPSSVAFPRSAHDPEFFCTVARLGIQAADGLQHAHEMGVVHRDIKPGNLILDGRGCLRITDFGLARTAQTADTTVSAAVAGTLRYMSPEQLSGARHVLDHRTDIYSLGVTLYELLTLEPAFDSDCQEELMRRIAEEEPRSPRRTNRALPKDLETIVLKSMAKEPTGRYPSAKDLADDLRRFLEHKPILARPASFGDRLVKWSRRHLWVIWTLIGALAIGLVAASASSLIIWRARQEKEAARAKAQANFDDAVAAVDQMLSWVGQESLRNIPEAEQVRLGVLKDAAAFYERLHRRNSEDAMVQEQTGRAHLRVAELYRRLGYQDSAAASYQRAIDLLKDLVDGTSDGRVYRDNIEENYAGIIVVAHYRHLGRAYAGLGTVFHTIGDSSRAAQAFRQAIDVFGGGPSGSTLEGGDRTRVIEIRIQLAGVVADLGQLDQAEEYYRSDIQYLRQLMAEGPLWPEANRALSHGHNDLGNLLYRTGRCREAVESYRAAVELRRELAQAGPEEPEPPEELAWSLNNLGAALWSAGDLDKAEETLEGAVDVVDQLTRRFPTAASRHLAAVIHGNRALVKKGLRRDAEAEADSRRATEILEVLATECPRLLLYRQHLGRFLNNLGALLASQSKWPEAESVLRQAISTQRLLALVCEELPETSADLSRSLGNLASVLDSAARQAEAENVRRELAAIQSEATAKFSASKRQAQPSPADGHGPTQPIDVAVVASCPLLWDNDWSMREVSHRGHAVSQDWPIGAAVNRELAWTLTTQPNGSHEDLVHAAEEARRAVETDPWTASNWVTLGMAQYRLGEDAEAVKTLKTSVILDGREAAPMFLLALVHGRMGHFEQARGWYGMAVDSQKTDCESLKRIAGIRAEAETMLGSLSKRLLAGESAGNKQETTK